MYDLAIIGGGPAGYNAAIRATQLGLNTLLIERDALGGTCLNRGCIPTKTLLKSAELYEEICHGELFGLTANATPDFVKIYQRKEEVVKTLRAGIESLMKRNKITVLNGTAAFVSATALEVTLADGSKQQVEAKDYLIASGSEPARIPIPGIEYALNSNDALAGNIAGDEVIIIGGGVIGCEFATMYAAFGRKVTIVETLPRILANLDKDVATYLGMVFKKAGIRVLPSVRVQGIACDASGKRLVTIETKEGTQEVLSGDAVLVSAGRVPAIASLNLAAAGVEAGRGITVNDAFETNVPHIYAVGDVSSRIQLAHVAEAQAINTVMRIAGKEPEFDLATIPSCIYTSPEVACVGQTEFADASDVVIGKVPMGASGKALIEAQTTGAVKLAFSKTTRKLIGALIVCSRATDMIAELALAMKAGLTVDDLRGTIHPHPTLSESVRAAAEVAKL